MGDPPARPPTPIESDDSSAQSPAASKPVSLSKKYKSIRNRFREFFGVRIADIPSHERDVCDRYGERIIGMMLAGDLNPSTDDLKALYQTEETKKHARDWLTEASDIREYKGTMGFKSRSGFGDHRHRPDRLGNYSGISAGETTKQESQRRANSP
jgi:hypothetical protein